MLSAIKNIRYLYIRIVLALLVLAAGGFFVLTDHNFDTDYNKAGTFTDIKVLQMQNGDVIKQEVRFDHTTVHSIGVSVVNRTNVCDGIIEISLIDDNGNEVWSERTSASDFKLQKVKWYRVKSEVDVEQSYLLYISAVELDGLIQFAGLASEDSAEGADSMVLLNNEQQEEKSLFVEMVYSRRLDKISRVIILAWTIVLICHICAFEILYADKKRAIITAFLMVILAVICAYMRLKINFENRFNYKIFAGVIFLIAVAIILAIVMLLKGCKKVELYFILYATLFGILYSILLPPFSAPDEDRHFPAAYRLSNAIMGQKINDNNGDIYMIECSEVELVTYVDNQYFLRTFTKLLTGKEEENVISPRSNFLPKLPISVYIPQAVGLTIGRVLKLDNIRLVYCGRFTNLLFFIVGTAIAIKIIPHGKWIIFAICQIPLVMEVVTSYSYDAFILAMSFILIAYILKLNEQKEKISKKQLFILEVLSIIYAPLKIIYLPIITLAFLIPNKKISVMQLKSILYKCTILIISCTMVLAVYYCSFFSMGQISNNREKTDEVHTNTNEMILNIEDDINIIREDHYRRPNIDFILENPFDFIESCSGAVLQCGDEYLFSAFGKYLGWYDIILPTYVAISAMILLCLSFVNDDCYTTSGMTTYKKRWIFLVILGCCIAALLAFYITETNPSQKIIAGVQGRYFIPVLGCIVFFLQGGHRKNEYTDSSIVMLASMVNVMALMGICSEVWSR